MGTLNLNRNNVPKEVKDKKLEKGKFIDRLSVRHSTKMAWQKKCNYGVNLPQCRKRVSNEGKETEKPLFVIDYNQNMRGADLKDQLLQM
jgi:hypothetical protein